MAEDTPIAIPRRESEDLGMERYCRWCDEWWPEDRDFWNIRRDGRIYGRCRACWQEYRVSKRGVKQPRGEERCGTWMPQSHAPCVRRLGHASDHRSAIARAA